MSITEALICAPHGRAAEKLRTCPSLRAAFNAAYEYKGMLHLDVFRALIAVDFFGNTYGAETEDEMVWASAKTIPVLCKRDLGPAEHEGCIGTWRIPFLRWLKAVSVATNDDISIHYDHGREDYLYNVAWWYLRPTSLEMIEGSGITSYDGMKTPRWSREVIRFPDGRIEVREK